MMFLAALEFPFRCLLLLSGLQAWPELLVFFQQSQLAWVDQTAIRANMG